MKSRKHTRKHIGSLLIMILFVILATGSILAHSDHTQVSSKSSTHAQLH